MAASALSFAKFKVRPLEAVVLMHHIVHCKDAENDADRTVKELITELDTSRGWLSKGLLESALYCCNMENERGKFWHPLGKSFDRFLHGIIPPDLHFDRYYNVIYELRSEKKSKT